MRRILITLVLALTPIFASAQSGSTTLFRQPTINKNEIVFVYAGDLWRVSRSGGSAERLGHRDELLWFFLRQGLSGHEP